MKKIAFIFIILFISNLLYSQMVVVKGKVTAFHKYALKNIVVKASKSDSKKLTNEYGEFEIVCQPNETIIFESQSFKIVKHKIKDPKDSVIVNLVLKDTKKSKEYAISNGIISEGNLAYALSNLKDENNDFYTYGNIYDLIVGKFAGVEVLSGNIIIRGIKSLNASNSALLVVNGIVVQDISFISPNQVKTIEIVKGPDASMYGSRGANGVVCITTK
jgi:TonB-dependent SusC/RagA subfamily outer membrane receptor